MASKKKVPQVVVEQAKVAVKQAATRPVVGPKKTKSKIVAALKKLHPMD
jgi:hypothetical protein